MKIKIMSFNVRCDVTVDGANYFFNRADRVLELIKEESPDIIGFQETTAKIRAWLQDNITDEYVIVGCGRNARFGCESTSIAYKKHMFELYSFETKQLSLTPHIPGSIPEGVGHSACPRIFSHAALVNAEMKKPLHFFNTHLDYTTPMSRTLGMTVVLQYLTACDGPVVLTGDMNAEPDELAAQMPTQIKERPLVDATADIPGTFHGFGSIKENLPKIDYIYTDAKILECYPRDDGDRNGVWISDHFPVVATIEVEDI